VYVQNEETVMASSIRPSVRPYQSLKNSFAISECVLELNPLAHLVKEFRRRLSSCLRGNVNIKAATCSWFISKFRMSYHGITSGRARPWVLLSL
jgi:hypothetical protein